MALVRHKNKRDADTLTRSQSQIKIHGLLTLTLGGKDFVGVLQIDSDSIDYVAKLEIHYEALGSAVAWWLMPLTPDPEVGGSSPTRVKPFYVLEQGTFTPQKVLAISRKRWFCPNMTEKLFTGTLRINQPSLCSPMYIIKRP